MTLKELKKLRYLLQKYHFDYQNMPMEDDSIGGAIDELDGMIQYVEERPEGKAELLADKVQECPID